MRILAVLFLIACCAGELAAQRMLRVRVVTADNEPIQGVTVSLLRPPDNSSVRFAPTDADGRVFFDDIAAGVYLVRAEIIGFEAIQTRVTLVNDTSIDIRLRQRPVQMDPVTARGERARERFEQEAGATVRELTRAEMKLIPGLAEADVMRAVEALPGVVTTSDFSSAFNVRGGSADQNLILLDGIPIYNPFHLGGVFSVFNSDMVERAELLAGGFPAQYGGRVSSVLNVITDPGDGSFDVRGGISVLATRLSVGGSVPGLENSRVRVGVRRSYFDQLLKPFLDFPYHLTDAQLAGEVWTSSRDRFGVSAYLGEDVLELSGADSFPLRVDWKWGNAVTGLRWSRSLRNNGLFDVRSSYSRFSTEMTFPDFSDTRFTSRIEHALLRADGAWPVGNLELRAGVETNRLWYDNLIESGGTVFGGGSDLGWAHGAYAQTAWRVRPDLLIESGLRADLWQADDGSTFLLSPRVAVKHFLNNNVAIKIAGGRYNQFIHSLRDEELPVGIDVWVLSGTRAPQVRSDQVQTGVEWYVGDWYAALESYWRRFRGVATNNFAQDPNDPADDIIAGDGLSYGADAIIRKDRGKITGFATVSWLKAEREFPDFLQGSDNPPNVTYPPVFDRRVELDVVVRFPVFRKWEGGLRFNFGSGLPYTRPIGNYFLYEYQIESGRRSGDQEDSTFVAVLLGQRNSARYPEYHRLDLSVRKTFTKSWGTLTPHLDILNLYNRKNVLFYFYEYEQSPPVRSGISMFPFLPTIGLEVVF
jgi:hypothetical protein